MGLGIYTDKTPSSLISDSGARTAPLVISIDGHKGGTKEVLLYLRADDTGTYTSPSVRPVLTDSGKNVINDTDFYWKVSEGLIKPTAAEWAAITKAAAASFTTVTNAPNTYNPFWVLVAVPSNAEVKSYKHVTLRISYS